MKTFLFAFTLLISNVASAQFQFENRYTGQSGTDAKAIRQTLDSGYVVVGGQSQPTTVLTVMKLNPMGDTVWTTDFSDPPAFGFNVDQTLDSGYIVTGYAFDPASSAILVKLDQYGNVEWSETYSTVSEWGQAVKQLPDSGYIVAGQRIFRTDKSGVVLWSQATAGGNQAMSMIWSSDGNLVYTQTSSSTSGGTWLTKMDTDGNQIWTESYSDLYTHSNCDNNVAETSDGGFIIAGQPTDETQGMIMKLDSDRDFEWSQEFQPGIVGSATSVVESDSGGYLACGYKVDATGVHAYLHRTDMNGNMLWEKEYEKGHAQSLIATNDGGYSFAGYKENNSGNQKYFVVKIGGNTPLSVEEKFVSNDRIFPTASSGVFQVHCKDCFGQTAHIIDLRGQAVGNIILKKDIDLGYLSTGSYFLINQSTQASNFVQIIR
jgi:hypothetical protein